MIDLITLTLIAGDGGNGRVSFRHEKYAPKGGPDGGYGGDGGNIIIRATRSLNTLKHFSGKKEISAEPGGYGGRKKSTGRKGEDTIVEVPLGTVLWLEKENHRSLIRRKKYGIDHLFTKSQLELQKYYLEEDGQGVPFRELEQIEELPEREALVTLTEDGQEVIVCQGGFGGRGNIAFKGSTNTTPLEAEYGTEGEKKVITFELKLLADIGLVGYPNAGKSTLLSKITKANPKTANYPFTTIEPNLGVMSFADGRDVVVADIPGLIEGASEGKGLGLDFLRHVENSQMLLFVLFLEESDVSNTELSDEEKVGKIWEQYQLLRKELKQYHESLLEKPFLVSVNKIDIYSEELRTAIIQKFTAEKQNIFLFSGFTGEGLEALQQQIAHMVVNK